MAGTVVVDTVKSSTSNPPTIQNTSGTEIGKLCRAWVNFNGSTAVIQTSFNVSSVTRNGTGDYTVNFSNSFPDANYTAIASAGTPGTAFCLISINTSGGTGTEVAPTASACRFNTGYSVSSGNVVDPKYTYFAVFR